LLGLVFVLFFLLATNSLYLGAITLTEQLTGGIYQDDFYLMMFLLHLLLGLLLIVPFLLFGLLHYRRARLRRNRYAIRAGKALYLSGLLLLFSGLLLSRIGLFSVDDPAIRQPVYWLHVLIPLVALWLFLVHRLAGPRIHWRFGAAWSSAALLLAGLLSVGQFLRQSPAPALSGAPFSPSLVRVDSQRPLIPPTHLMRDAFCAECHTEIARQHAQGMHHFSSFNNPAYGFSIEATRQELLARDGSLDATRLCAVCHDQVPLFSGRFDDPDYDPEHDPGARAGITCLGCHAITAINSPRGNGSYDFADPPHYPFAFSKNPLLQAINRQLIKAKPELHKEAMLKPFHRSAEFCSVCHKVHLPYTLNHYKWLRGQDHYDSFLHSGVSGHRVDSFYYPAKAIPNCAACHMPPHQSDDPAARELAGRSGRSVHQHLFGAANTGVPWFLGLPPKGQALRRQFLRRAARVDLFGLREGGDIDGPLLAPLRPELPALKPGRHYLLELVVRTTGIGHQLTQGTSDSNQLWLEVTASSGERLVGQSGALSPHGEVDPWAYFINSYLLDRQGRRIERRDAQHIFVTLYNHQIPPGAASTIHYGLTLPADLKGPVTLRARLRYRKFDSRFLRHVLGDQQAVNDLPITTLAEDQLVLPVGEAQVPAGQTSPIPTWERWNDYGIGLLRKGKRELRQAEEAFARVERLQPADGALNLARVHFREGLLKETTRDLQRARAAQAYPWVISWYSALVDQQSGRLDSAIAHLEDLLATRFPKARARGFDFSKDVRLLDTLGLSLFERARQARGQARKAQRRSYLERAREILNQALVIDPEDQQAHYDLALVYAALGDEKAAHQHRRLHEKYRPDEHAVEQAVALHRRHHPAANHAAEATAIYALRPPLATGSLSGRLSSLQEHRP